MRGLPTHAISVRQPWAWAIIHAGKDVENRIKRAITMGKMDLHPAVAIHAAIGMTRDEYELASDFMLSIGIQCPHPSRLVRGGIIGRVSVAGITKTSASPWFFGPWALQLADPAPVDPIPCAGNLGAFRWQPNSTEALRQPLPWMISWPARPTPNRATPAAPQEELKL